MAAGAADCDVCRLCAVQVKSAGAHRESGTTGEIVSVAYRLLRADYALLLAGQFWRHRGYWSSVGYGRGGGDVAGDLLLGRANLSAAG